MALLREKTSFGVNLQNLTFTPKRGLLRQNAVVKNGVKLLRDGVKLEKLKKNTDHI